MPSKKSVCPSVIERAVNFNNIYFAKHAFNGNWDIFRKILFLLNLKKGPSLEGKNMFHFRNKFFPSRKYLKKQAEIYVL